MKSAKKPDFHVPRRMGLGRFLLRRASPVLVLFAIAGAVAPPMIHFGIPNGSWLELVTEGDLVQDVVGVFSAVLLAQIGLLCGAPALRCGRPIRKRSGWISVVSSALVINMLFTGLALGAFQICALTSYTAVYGPMEFLETWLWWCIIVLMITRCGQSRFKAIHRTLMAGTVLEMAVVLSMAVIDRWRVSGYYLNVVHVGLNVGILAATVAFGPAIVLLMSRRYLRPIDRGLCGGCGYDLRGLPEARCPECGRPFDPRFVKAI